MSLWQLERAEIYAKSDYTGLSKKETSGKCPGLTVSKKKNDHVPKIMGTLEEVTGKSWKSYCSA